MKKCCKCEETKGFDQFAKSSRYNKYPTSAAGYYYRCKSCRLTHTGKRRLHINKNNREYYARSKKRQNQVKNSNLKRKYGITLEIYNSMFLSQNGCCAICDTHQQDLKKKLAVDHDHGTGLNRDLICHHCNVSLGYLKEDKRVIMNMIRYIDKHNPELADNNTNVVVMRLKKEG